MLWWKFWKRPPSLRFEDNFSRKKPWFHLVFERHGGAELVIGISIGGTIWGLHISTWVTIALVVASVTYTILSKPKKPEVAKGAASDLANSGHLLNLRSQSDPLRVIYGVFRKDGNLVFRRE
jgi:hypothetical protein